MIEWIVSFIPWWVWLGLGVIALGTLRIYAGSWKNVVLGAVGIGAAVGSILLFKRGQHVGETSEQRKAARNAEKAIKRADKVRDRANARNADPKRVRDNDGFRRDS